LINLQPGLEIRITSYKSNKKKLKSLIPANPMLEDEIEKKSIKKSNPSQFGLTC